MCVVRVRGGNDPLGKALGLCGINYLSLIHQLFETRDDFTRASS
jgi:hypothetical protein